MSLAGQLVPPANGTRAGGGAPGGPRVEPPHCHYVDYDYEPLAAVGCCMYILFGIVYTLFGYRCFKAVMFLTGFTFGTVIVYLICLQEHLMPAYGNASVAFSAGFLFGLITMLIQYVGLFMTGLHTGLFVAIAGLAAYDYLSEKTHHTIWLCVSTLLGTAILFAILNLCWKKGLTIFGTAVYGGAILAASLDFLIERLAMANWMCERINLQYMSMNYSTLCMFQIWERINLRPSVPVPCWFSWLILGVWPFMTVLGLLTQSCITGTGVHHEESISAQKKRLKNGVQRPRTREQRAEMRQRKYRYLYQVRTKHGDVISQSFVQALQKRAECSTLQSDATHLTILPGAEPLPHTLSDSDEDPR